MSSKDVETAPAPSQAPLRDAGSFRDVDKGIHSGASDAGSIKDPDSDAGSTRNHEYVRFQVCTRTLPSTHSEASDHRSVSAGTLASGASTAYHATHVSVSSHIAPPPVR